MKKYLHIIFIMVAAFGLVVTYGLFAQPPEEIEHHADDEKCAKVVYLEDSSEIKITNPVETEYLVQIYNLTGIVVKQEEEIKTEVIRINVSELVKGIYLVKITPVPHLQSATFKVVIR